MELLIVFSAKYLIFIEITLFCGIVAHWLYRTQHWWFTIQIIVSGALALTLSRAAQSLYYNPRPFVTESITPLVQHVADNGFPSDHALLAATLAFLVWLKSPKLGVGFLGLAILIGVSRILVNVHHSLDVLAAFGLALFAVLATDSLFRYIQKI